MTNTQTQEAPGQDRATAATGVIGYAVRHLREGFDFYEMDFLSNIAEQCPGADAVVNVFRNRDAAAAMRLQRGWSPDEAKIVPVTIAADQETQDDDVEDEVPLDPLPSADDLAECGAVMSAVEDVLSWINEDDVQDTAKGVRVDSGVHSFLKLVHCFAGDFRIRRTREDDPERVARGQVIIEDKASVSRLAAKSEDSIWHMERAGILQFDDADVIHVTDKGLQVIQFANAPRLHLDSLKGGER